MVKLKRYSIRGIRSARGGVYSFTGMMSDVHPIFKNIEIVMKNDLNSGKISLGIKKVEGYSSYIETTNLFANVILSLSELRGMISQCGGVSMGGCSLYSLGKPEAEGLIFFSVRQVLGSYFLERKLVMASGPNGSDLSRLIIMYNNFADKIGTFNKWEVSKKWYNPNSGNTNNLYTLDLNNEAEPLEMISDKTIKFLEGL